MRVLAGDIGGTNSRMAAYEADGERLELVARRTFPSEGYDGLTPIVQEFLHEEELECRRACFGVAGPVRGGKVRTTNLPWVIEADTLEATLGLERVFLLNDLEAAAWGIPALAPRELVTLHEGSEESGNRALIAAGTGLGEAGLYWDGRRHQPFATEGGHADFAPLDDGDAGFLAFLRREYGHVSWERVVSGPGLVALHRFLAERMGPPASACPVAEVGDGDDVAAAVTRGAVTGDCRVCAESLDAFVRLYGAEAGNLALKHMARGGVFVGGGIAPKILDTLRDGRFIEAFLAKGRMRYLLEEMPVKVITNDHVAILGAARRAAHP